MNELELKHLVEATLLAAGRPVSSDQLAELFDERDRPSREELRRAIALLEEDYAARGIEIREVASGWRIQIRPQCIDVVSRLWQERPSRYSRALLETLALIAYRQPITRSEIEEIRGVTVASTIMRTLQERGWIRVVGHRDVPGRPELLGTTRDFLDYFGLRSLDELPTLAELRDVENLGVQLELDSGGPVDVSEDATIAEAATVEPAPSVDAAADAAAVVDEPADDTEEADAAEQGEAGSRPTLVADATEHDGAGSQRTLYTRSADRED